MSLEERLNAVSLELDAARIEAKATIAALRDKHCAMETLMLKVLVELERVYENGRR